MLRPCRQYLLRILAWRGLKKVAVSAAFLATGMVVHPLCNLLDRSDHPRIYRETSPLCCIEKIKESHLERFCEPSSRTSRLLNQKLCKNFLPVILSN